MAKKDDAIRADDSTHEDRVNSKSNDKGLQDTGSGVPHEESVAASGGQRPTPWPLITVGVFVTILLFALGAIFVMQFALLRGERLHMMQESDRYSQTSQFGSDDRGWRHDMMEGRGMYGRPELMGVVSAVSGDALTVVGNGKQTTVKKSSDTVVSGDSSSLRVNDSVLIYGTTGDDGTLTATRIVVRNTAQLDGAPIDGKVDSDSRSSI